MPKGTKTLGNSKALAWESRGFVHKKEDVYILTHPQLYIVTLMLNISMLVVFTASPLW